MSGPTSRTPELEGERDVERVLRWAMVELGSAGLVDRLGREIIVPDPPREWLQADVAVAGPVLLLAREPTNGVLPRFPSFAVLAEHVSPGVVVLIHADRAHGSAFGSNLALLAAASGAQAMASDGTWRDTHRLGLVGLPVGSFGRGASSSVGCPYVRRNEQELFGACWQEGDWFLRDRDAAIRLGSGAAATAAAQCAREFETEVAALIGR